MLNFEEDGSVALQRLVPLFFSFGFLHRNFSQEISVDVRTGPFWVGLSAGFRLVRILYRHASERERLHR